MTAETNLDPNAQGKETEKASKKKFRIGIIGTGGIAHAHMNAYKTFDNVEIVALADIVPGRAAAFAKEFDLPNAKIYADHKELIDSEKEP